MFWLVIHLINRLFKIQKKAFLTNAPYISPPPTDASLKISLHFLHLWSIGQKGFLLYFKNMVYWLNHRLKCPEVVILASFLWGNLKAVDSVQTICRKYNYMDDLIHSSTDYTCLLYFRRSKEYSIITSRRPSTRPYAQSTQSIQNFAHIRWICDIQPLQARTWKVLCNVH